MLLQITQPSWQTITQIGSLVSILAIAVAGGRAYQKLKSELASLTGTMAEKWQTHDQEIRRLIDAQTNLNDQMIEIARHEERLSYFHKRLQKVEDTHINVGTMANSVAEIRAKLFERK